MAIAPTRPLQPSLPQAVVNPDEDFDSANLVDSYGIKHIRTDHDLEPGYFEIVLI